MLRKKRNGYTGLMSMLILMLFGRGYLLWITAEETQERAISSG